MYVCIFDFIVNCQPRKQEICIQDEKKDTWILKNNLNLNILFNRLIKRVAYALTSEVRSWNISHFS